VMNSLTKSLESGDLQPEQLTMILDAQERILDRQARQDFAVAMADCQAEMPQILKTEYNKQTSSNFESLDGLNKAIIPVYTKNGFSVSFGTGDCPIPVEKGDTPWLRVTADVSHRGGWEKQYHYDLPYDIAGIKGSVNKTKIHASGSTLSYGKRYLLKLIFNLITTDDVDNDAQQEVEYIDDKQLGILRDLMSSTDTAEETFSSVCKVDSMDLLPSSKYEQAHGLLTEKQENL